MKSFGSVSSPPLSPSQLRREVSRTYSDKIRAQISPTKKFQTDEKQQTQHIFQSQQQTLTTPQTIERQKTVLKHGRKKKQIPVLLDSLQPSITSPPFNSSSTVTSSLSNFSSPVPIPSSPSSIKNSSFSSSKHYSLPSLDVSALLNVLQLYGQQGKKEASLEEILQEMEGRQHSNSITDNPLSAEKHSQPHHHLQPSSQSSSKSRFRQSKHASQVALSQPSNTSSPVSRALFSSPSSNTSSPVSVSTILPPYARSSSQTAIIPPSLNEISSSSNNSITSLQAAEQRYAETHHQDGTLKNVTVTALQPPKQRRHKNKKRNSKENIHTQPQILSSQQISSSSIHVARESSPVETASTSVPPGYLRYQLSSVPSTVVSEFSSLPSNNISSMFTSPSVNSLSVSSVPSSHNVSDSLHQSSVIASNYDFNNDDFELSIRQPNFDTIQTVNQKPSKSKTKQPDSKTN